MTLARDIPNVLASFRTNRRDMWTRAADEFAFEAEQAIPLLADMAEDYGAKDVIPVVRKAIASTFRVLMRADDSNGSIQLVIAELLNLHAELCAQEPPAPATLAAWIQKQQFGELGEYFRIDVADYEEALGERGLARFQEQLDKRCAELSSFTESPELEFSHDDGWHARHALRYNLQRLAVLREDEEAIIRTHGGDLPRAHLRAAAAKALAEAGFVDRAADVAHEGMDLPGGDFQQQECGELWVELVSRARRADAAAAAFEVFERWPTAANAQAWQEQAGDAWRLNREAAIARMREHVRELVSYLLADGDVERAWREALQAAQDGRSLPPDLWDELVRRYAKIDPVAVLPVMVQLIDDRLVEANTRVYPGAVRRMTTLRAAARDAGTPEFAERFFAELRTRHARRSSLIGRMDAAGP
ncbi:DUF6880 family protein [Microbacterium luticocti]|uniref:DUF6880 family protein n=1 Tax=Microbacterium luticocti TaxID=451764 RepID=UPI000412208A|nr:DUF6880 family protein [Microbacterium luticocti]